MAPRERDRKRAHLNAERLAALSTPVRLRLAGAADTAALARLAGRDSRPLPPGPHLVAERDGRIDAALSLRTGETLADPFRPTAELRALLRCHAGERRAAPARRTATRLQPRPRLVPA